MSVVHVRYNGESKDIEFVDLFPEEKYEALGIPGNVPPTAATIGTGIVRTALAQYFDVGLGEFSDYVVEPHDNGNMTVRPKATFG